jgi:hypothetical protein
MSRLFPMSACVLLGLCLSWTASAQTAAPAPAPAPVPATPAELFPVETPARSWAVTTSVPHLLFPILEVTVERRLSSNLGVAVMVGAGKVTAESAVGVENTFRAFELGLSARYYVLGNFASGMQVGGAIEYLGLKGDNLNNTMVSGSGSGLLVAPFIGYKHTWSGGLTFDGQLGPGFVAARAEADNGAMTEENNTFAYLNLNLGWSF